MSQTLQNVGAEAKQPLKIDAAAIHFEPQWVTPADVVDAGVPDEIVTVVHGDRTQAQYDTRGGQYVVLKSANGTGTPDISGASVIAGDGTGRGPMPVRLPPFVLARVVPFRP